MRDEGRSRLPRTAVALAIAVIWISGASVSRAEFTGMGPIGPFGFPLYYEDANGLALELCADPFDPLCLLDPLPDPSAPPDVATGNFFDESFYWLADATMPTPGGFAQLVMALEAVFDNPTGTVVDGDQLVFARLRIRVDVVPEESSKGHYTVTTPFGVYEFDVTQVGNGIRAINFTDDCLSRTPPTCGEGIGNSFTTPLDPTTPIGPFLVWDPTQPPPPPPGHVGDANFEHTVVGSPFGTNFFRVEGPNVGGPGINVIETDRFTVLGKLASVCGNGVVEANEECDDGNLVDGDCCSSTCVLEPAGSPCDDGNPCTINETCDGAGTCGGATVLEGGPCDDGNLCTGADACNAFGTCIGVPIVLCNDGNPCTDDVCDPATGTCQNPFNRAPCDDGDLCTLNDICNGAGVCVGGPPPDCNDMNPCTDDLCDPAVGCVHVDNADPCDDGNACTQGETCSAGTCGGGVPLDCDDGNVCTADSCDVLLGCVHTDITASCDDGDACTIDRCDPVAGCLYDLVQGCTNACGDVNGDMTVGVVDALLIAQLEVGLRTCPSMPRADLCDVNPPPGDGMCNIGDALKMAQCSVGLISCVFDCTPFACP